MADISSYECVVGLEIHVQLNTLSKAFSGDATSYGDKANSHTSVISLGHPGTLPVLNEKVVENAVKLGLACGAQIREYNEFARKNYFYADLPKGYQISQHLTPICTGGSVMIKDAQGNPKRIGLTRIHMEEDSGKSIHDLDPFNTLIDLNRAGVALLEIVSEPDFRNGEEAYNYLSEMRKLVRYLDISDGNMEEGSLRCDVNVSVRKFGAEKFGTKVEVKNLNSFRHVQKAIDFEVQRQVDLIESGGTVMQETRTFDATKNITTLMRTKEDAQDYRYFPEPDLSPVIITEEYKETVNKLMPKLPWELMDLLTQSHGLSEYDASLITENKAMSDYYLACCMFSKSYKNIVNYLMGPVKSHLNEKAWPIEKLIITPKALVDLLNLVEAGKVSHTVAQGNLFKLLLAEPNTPVEQLAKENNLIQESDENLIKTLAEEVLAAMPDKVAEFKAGKKGLMGLFMGELMKKSKGKAEPKTATQILNELLNQ